MVEVTGDVSYTDSIFSNYLSLPANHRHIVRRGILLTAVSVLAAKNASSFGRRFLPACVVYIIDAIAKFGKSILAGAMLQIVTRALAFWPLGYSRHAPPTATGETATVETPAEDTALVNLAAAAADELGNTAR